MLTGAFRSASVRAAAKSTLYRLSSSQFNRIADTQSGFRKAVEAVIQDKMHAAGLSAALYRSQLFGQLDAEILRDIQGEIELVPLKKGDQIIAQNESSDSLYVVVSGQLRVFEKASLSRSGLAPEGVLGSTSGAPIEIDAVALDDSDVDMIPLVDIGLGQTFGEIGFLTGEPRNASVYALRDTLVGRLIPGSYYRLLQKYPKALTRLFSSKLMSSLGAPKRKKNRTFALIGINAKNAVSALPIDMLARRLCWHLENPWSPDAVSSKGKINAAYINENITNQLMGSSGISESLIDSAAHLQLQSWFAEMEKDNEYLFFGANYFSEPKSVEPNDNAQASAVSNWLDRIALQVDQVVYVIDANTDLSSIALPPCFDKEKQLISLDPSSSLLLLHPEKCKMPSNTKAWLDKFSVDSHHHVRWSDSDDSAWKNSASSDIARVSRLLAHTGVGLVLSGGAARGFAHIGIVRAMHEAGVPIDLFGGSSAGAISASIIASGYTDDQARDLVLKHGKRESMNDFTLPSTSLFRGKRFSELMRIFVGAVNIEDLWNPYYCVSINMANASEVVHRRGPLWKHVRASASMPILLPPVTDEGRLLVDGAMLNAMPVEIMRSDPACGIVIGIDVSGGTGMRGEFTYGTELSGWRQLLRNINPFAKPYRSPRFASTILAISAIGAVGRLPSQRANTDLYIRPPVHKFQMMDYDSREQIMQAGYEAGKTEIASWLEQRKNEA